MEARPIVLHNNFREGFGQYTDQTTPFKSCKQLEKH